MSVSGLVRRGILFFLSQFFKFDSCRCRDGQEMDRKRETDVIVVMKRLKAWVCELLYEHFLQNRSLNILTAISKSNAVTKKEKRKSWHGPFSYFVQPCLV